MPGKQSKGGFSRKDRFEPLGSIPARDARVERADALACIFVAGPRRCCTGTCWSSTKPIGNSIGSVGEPPVGLVVPREVDASGTTEVLVEDLLPAGELPSSPAARTASRQFGWASRAAAGFSLRPLRITFFAAFSAAIRRSLVLAEMVAAICAGIILEIDEAPQLAEQVDMVVDSEEFGYAALPRGAGRLRLDDAVAADWPPRKSPPSSSAASQRAPASGERAPRRPRTPWPSPAGPSRYASCSPGP